MNCADLSARRRAAERLWLLVRLRIEAKRRAAFFRWRQERIDEEGCGAAIALWRIARDDWF